MGGGVLRGGWRCRRGEDREDEGDEKGRDAEEEGEGLERQDLEEGMGRI